VVENLSYAARHHTELALILVKIEKYKVMFLRRGKQTAEEILRRTAQLLSQERRREDKIARIGMDTFALLLPSANSIGARRVGDHIHQSLQSHDFDIDGESIPVRTSLAISFAPIGSGTSADTLISDATAKLKQAVESGGNCIQYHEDTSPATVDDGVTVNKSGPPEKPLVASSTEVEQALQALMHQRHTGNNTTTLVQTVLPLLQAWSRENDGICATQLEDIRNALNTEHNIETNDLASAPS
jgi:diguanylate cyclase (GGDEF)-like protein